MNHVHTVSESCRTNKGRTTNVTNTRTLPTISCSNLKEEIARIKRDIKESLIFLNCSLMFIKINNFGIQHLNGYRHLFHPFCYTTRIVFEPLHVYKLSFNMVYLFLIVVLDTFTMSMTCGVTK